MRGRTNIKQNNAASQLNNKIKIRNYDEIIFLKNRGSSVTENDIVYWSILDSSIDTSTANISINVNLTDTKYVLLPENEFLLAVCVAHGNVSAYVMHPKYGIAKYNNKFYNMACFAAASQSNTNLNNYNYNQLKFITVVE